MVSAHRRGLTDRYFYESFTDRDALLATVWDQMRDETLMMLLGAITKAPQDDPLLQLQPRSTRSCTTSRTNPPEPRSSSATTPAAPCSNSVGATRSR